MARFLRALVATNLKASVALRGAFFVRAGFMFLNNFIFLVAWWVFFERFEEVRGWRLADTAAVYGLAAASFGLMCVFGQGVMELARTIANGDLDGFLLQPKDPLLHVVASKSGAEGWGDIASSAVLFALSGLVGPVDVFLCIALGVCGAIVFTASGVLFHSLAFWLGDTNTMSRQIHQFVIVFCIYPKTVFGGWLRVALFSVAPAGFITWIPVDLLRSFSWPLFGTLVAATVAYAALARRVFHAGLSRYESGNRFGVRA